jgi:hypothetical protein
MIKQSVSRKRTTRKHRNPKRTTRKHRNPKRTTKKQRKPKRTTKKQRKPKRTTKKTQPKRQNKSKKVMKGGGESYEVISAIKLDYKGDEIYEDGEEIDIGDFITNVKPYNPTSKNGLKAVKERIQTGVNSEVLLGSIDGGNVKFYKYGEYGPVVIKKDTPNLDIKKKLLKIISKYTETYKRTKKQELEKKNKNIESYITFRLIHRYDVYNELVIFLMANYTLQMNTSIHTKWTELQTLIAELKKEYSQLHTYESLHIINDIITQGIRMDTNPNTETFKFFPELVALINEHGKEYSDEITHLSPGTENAEEISDRLLMKIIMKCYTEYDIVVKIVDKIVDTEQHMINIMIMRYNLYKYLKRFLLVKYSVSTLEVRLNRFLKDYNKEIIQKGIEIIKEIIVQRTQMASKDQEFVFLPSLRTIITNLESNYRTLTHQDDATSSSTNTENDIKMLNTVIEKWDSLYNFNKVSYNISLNRTTANKLLLKEAAKLSESGKYDINGLFLIRTSIDNKVSGNAPNYMITISVFVNNKIYHGQDEINTNALLKWLIEHNTVNSSYGDLYNTMITLNRIIIPNETESNINTPVSKFVTYHHKPTQVPRQITVLQPGARNTVVESTPKTELLEKINAVFIKLINKYNTQELSTIEEFKKDVITNITGLNDIQIWEFINLFLDYNKDKYSTNKGWKDMYNMINPYDSEAYDSEA